MARKWQMLFSRPSYVKGKRSQDPSHSEGEAHRRSLALGRKNLPEWLLDSSVAEAPFGAQRFEFDVTADFGQVERVASSMSAPGQTMNEIVFATGLGDYDDAVPQLWRPVARVEQ